MGLSRVPSTKPVVVLMPDSVKALEKAIEKATEMAIALAAKGVQPLRAKPVAQHRHRVVAVVVPTQKAPALTVTVTVTARAIAVAVQKIAAAIAVPDQRHAPMHRAVMVVRNSVARGAKFV